jgi:hypothetical protein
MRLVHEVTGDVLECPMPNEIGESAVILNGHIVERVLFSNENGTVTTGDGKTFNSGAEFADYVVSILGPRPESPEGR